MRERRAQAFSARRRGRRGCPISPARSTGHRCSPAWTPSCISPASRMPGRHVPDAAYDRVNHLATAELARAAAAARRPALRVRLLDPRAERPARRSSADREPSRRGRPTPMAAPSSPPRRRCARPACRTRSCARCWSMARTRRAISRSLIRLARPAAAAAVRRGFANRRSLLALDNLIAAIRFALEDAARRERDLHRRRPAGRQRRRDHRDAARRAGPPRRACSACRPRLLALAVQPDRPARDMGAARRLARSADPTKLMAAGWRPVTDTRTQGSPRWFRPLRRRSPAPRRAARHRSPSGRCARAPAPASRASRASPRPTA